jgi:dihydrofolate reductase
MRKVVMLNRVSMDGFFAGPNGEIDWFIHDPEVDKAAHGRGQSDTLLMGRLTYQMFEGHWPHVAADPNAPEGERMTADELTRMTKVVFSTTLQDATWESTRLVKGHILKEVRELKQGEGSDMLIFGSGTIVQQLAEAGLIDEYLFILTPVLVGTGKPLFKGQKMNLKLLETRGFNSGNVLLHYGIPVIQ